MTALYKWFLPCYRRIKKSVLGTLSTPPPLILEGWGFSLCLFIVATLLMVEPCSHALIVENLNFLLFVANLVSVPLVATCITYNVLLQCPVNSFLVFTAIVFLLSPKNFVFISSETVLF